MKNKKIIIILTIILLLLIVACACVYFIFLHGNDTISDNSNLVNETQSIPPTAENVVEEFVEIQEDGSKLNVSTKLNETKNVDGFEISNINLSMSAGMTFLTADVTNKTGRNTDVTAIDIIYLDKEGNEITTLGGVIDPLNNGDTAKLNAITTLDFANAYDFKVVIK